MESVRIRVIVHGKQADNGALRDAVASARGHGHDVDVRTTWEAGDAVVLAREAAAAGIAVVAAAGGDGILNEVARGLVGPAPRGQACPSLGLIPLGTANDFAGAAGIPLEPEAALNLMTSTTATPVDAGRSDDRIFVNVATGGVGTDVTVATPDELKGVLGPLAYRLTGAARFPNIDAVEARISFPQFSWVGRFIALAMCNGRQAGGGVPLCPGALIDDGLLDLAIVPSPDEAVLTSLGKLIANGPAALWRRAVRARVSWIEIDANEEISLNLDGEPITSARFRIEVLPSAIRMHLPPDSPLLGRRA